MEHELANAEASAALEQTGDGNHRFTKSEPGDVAAPAAAAIPASSHHPAQSNSRHNGSAHSDVWADDALPNASFLPMGGSSTVDPVSSQGNAYLLRPGPFFGEQQQQSHFVGSSLSATDLRPRNMSTPSESMRSGFSYSHSHPHPHIQSQTQPQAQQRSPILQPQPSFSYNMINEHSSRIPASGRFSIPVSLAYDFAVGSQFVDTTQDFLDGPQSPFSFS